MLIRLDISARGVWSTFERTFFDIRIFNAKSLSYQSKTLPQLYTLQSPPQSDMRYPPCIRCVITGRNVVENGNAMTGRKWVEADDGTRVD